MRPMAVGDVPAAVELDRLSYPKGWEASLFERELSTRWSYATVVVEDERLLAHTIYWIVHDEMHLLNIAVHPDARGRGLARALMDLMREVCEAERLLTWSLEVRVSNTPALGLYRSYGFTQIGLRPGYYADNKEDAAILALALEPSPNPELLSGP